MDIASSLRTIVSLVSLLSASILEDPPPVPASGDLRISGNFAEYEYPKAQIERSNALARDSFPENFYFGFSTSAYQIEGAWNVSEKGESVWDHETHARPNVVPDGSNGDVAADFYHKYKEDIRLARMIGSRMFRISLSWTRILPNGYDNYVSPDGIRFYADVIDEIIKNGMEPMVTLHHWDLPNNLQQLGGWTSPLMPYLFQRYAVIAFAAFGNKVKYWVTINDPAFLCLLAYGGPVVPGLNQPGIADYMCAHNTLLAHAKAYSAYNDLFRGKQKGKVGITHRFHWFEPEDPTIAMDVLIAERSYQWFNDWILHPLLSSTGDYPDIMKKDIERISHMQGFEYSRLPSFSKTEIDQVLGSVDFLGVNFYSAVMLRTQKLHSNIVEFLYDIGVSRMPIYKEHPLKNTPWALEKLLKRLNNDYDLPDIFITENGYDGRGRILDINTVVYYHNHLSVVLKAMQSGVPIQGYLAWTLVDSFEWLNGYRAKYGVFQVDYKDKNLPRYPKLSAKLLSRIYTNGTLPDLKDFLSRSYVEQFIIILIPELRNTVRKVTINS